MKPIDTRNQYFDVWNVYWEEDGAEDDQGPRPKIRFPKPGSRFPRTGHCLYGCAKRAR
jgi:hypothetical protein